MDAKRWQRVKTVFQAVLEHPPAERQAYLEDRCREDAALREKVASMLDSDASASDFLQMPLVGKLPLTLPVTHRPGERIGAYRLVREIGRGGMGTVYFARRADEQFQQQVAVKVVRTELDTDDAALRFRAERQIQAGLQHPNIARLLDGGVTGHDLPYLVMEYVEGVPITEYCDAYQLSTNERIDLFCVVCEAVQHAHRNLVVHRDLKPSNVLVSEDGRPKLLDFGIAKMLGEEAVVPDAPLTRTGMRVLTPEYASPEQVRGEAITTASDVYQLGVLLYELLAGQRPYEVKELAPSDIERVICETEPLKPSAAVAPFTHGKDADASRKTNSERVSQLRDTEPQKLRRRLAGDLDNIVLMALRKEPERRYGSAEQLAEDLQRYREGLPVEARTDTWRYRTSKFVRRHRMGMAAAALLLLTLMGGIAATMWQARVAERERQRAERRFEDVRQLATAFLFEFHDAIADLPGSTEARALVVRHSLEYLDKLAQEAGDDHTLQLELATAYRKVGDVQGNPTNANLGQTQEALASYRIALALGQEAAKQDSVKLEARLVRALARQDMADVQAITGDLGAAHASQQASAETLKQLAAAFPDSTGYQVHYAVGLIKLGDLAGNPNFANRNQPREALASYQEARRLLERLRAAHPAHVEIERLHALIYERIGSIHEVLNDRAQALAAYRRSLKLRREFVNHHPLHTDGLRDLGVAHEKLGNMYVQTGALTDALDRYQRAHAAYERLLRTDPKTPRRNELSQSVILTSAIWPAIPANPILASRTRRCATTARGWRSCKRSMRRTPPTRRRSIGWSVSSSALRGWKSNEEPAPLHAAGDDIDAHERRQVASLPCQRPGASMRAHDYEPL